MIRFFLALLFTACAAVAATTNTVGRIVLVDDDGNTRPAQSVATPAQVSSAESSADAAKAAAQSLHDSATNASAAAASALQTALSLGTNYIVTSTVYVQSIGGVPYDPSNQTITVQSVLSSSSNVVVIGTVRQIPLTPPVLDWRQALTSGAWSNVTATVQQVSVPVGVTNAAAAYSFTLPRPSNTSAFFRIKDNSTGASGSGLYWLVFGGVWVDGHRGWSGTITNICGSVTNFYLSKGGAIVEPEPL